MAENNKMQRTISFRLNMKREDEKALYEEIMSHNRKKKDDSYGSGGAYIKAALKSFYGNEGKERQQKRDESLVKEIAEAVVEAMKNENVFIGGATVSVAGLDATRPKQGTFNSISEAEDSMPEEALSYLQNL